MPSVYRFGLPICTGHQRRGCEKLSCGYSAGEKLTDLVSCGPRFTFCDSLMLSMCATTVPSTAESVVLRSSALTVRWAVSSEGKSKLVTTWGYLKVTGPLLVK